LFGVLDGLSASGGHKLKDIVTVDDVDEAINDVQATDLSYSFTYILENLNEQERGVLLAIANNSLKKNSTETVFEN
jgi:hypothetical protein